MRAIAGAALALAAIGAGSVRAQAPDREIVAGALGAQLDTIVRRAEALGFGGQVLVERDGEIALHRAYGLRDWSAGSAYTLDTPTGIASVSKMLAAAAVLRMVDDGLLALSDTLGTLLPDVPTMHAGITVHQLLTHTSGLPGGYVEAGAATSLGDAAAMALDVRRDTARIGSWRYSSEGFLLLAAVVERRSGIRWHEYLRTRVLVPASMTHAFSMAGDVRPANAARSYVGARDATRLDRRPAVAGAGDVYATAGDLLRWSRVVRRRTLLGEDSWRRLETPHAPIADGYAAGYGAFLRERGATPPAIEHGGDDLAGPAAFVGIFRDPDITLVITSNARDHLGRWWRRALGDPLERALFADTADPPSTPLHALPAADRRALAGSYPAGEARVHLVDTGGPFLLVADGQDAIALVTGDTSVALANATRRVERMADSLLAGRDEAAFAELAQPDTRAAIAQWWAGFAETWGPLQRVHVTGSIRSGANVATQLVLHHERATQHVRVVTGSTGTLQQLDPDRVSPYALVMPVALEPDGTLRAEDPFTGAFVRFHTVDGRLRFGGIRDTGTSTGHAGWRPGGGNES